MLNLRTRWMKWWNRFFQPTTQTPNPTLSKHHLPPSGSPGYDLKIQLLGNFQISTPAGALPDIRSPRNTLLLAYFASEAGRKLQRDKLIGRFWPDVSQQSARNSFNVALHHIRRHFERHFSPDEQIIIHHRGTYQLNPAFRISTDVEQFDHYFQLGRQLEQTGDAAAALQAYHTAVHLYRGDLLEEYPYEEWVCRLRDQLKDRYLRALERLGYLHLQREDYRQAIFVFQQILHRDPCREQAHRTLMWCFAQVSQRDRAIRQYQRCEKTLRNELGVDPSPETMALYRRIVQGEPLQEAFLSRA